jgi:YbbR domain-containing protein
MKSFFRSLLFLKLLSLCAAVSLWYVVTTNISSLTITVPVEVVNVPEDTLLTASSVNQVAVRVRGPSFLLNTGLDGLKALKVALPKDVSQRYVVPIKPDELSLPSGVSVTSVDPSEVELRFDRKASKLISVEIPRAGRVGDGYRLQGVRWAPDMVLVEGPAGLLQDLKAVETYPLDLAALSESGSQELSLRKPAGSMTLSADRVTVAVEVLPIPTKRIFRRKRLEIRVAEGENRGVSPKEVRVTVSGPRRVVQGLSERDVIPFVRLAETDRLGSAVMVSVDRPDGIAIDAIEPPTVEVRGEGTSVIKQKFKDTATKIK